MNFFKNRRRLKRQRKERAQLIQLESMVKRLQLSQYALESKTSGVGNDLDQEVIVSLTTFDKRIEEVYIAIESIMQQSVKADRIVLCLSKQDCSPQTIPATLKLQEQRGLEILFCEEDLGPYTKYFYTLEKYPDSLILTVDDDFMYPPYVIDQLIRAYQQNPNVIHCARSHRIRFDDNGAIKPYKQWHWDHFDSTPSPLIFPTGVGGVLYFPGCLHPDALNKKAFQELCPKADDVWLKAMSLRQGVQCAQVPDHRDWGKRFLTIEGTQEFSLKRQNKQASSGNDHKIQRVFDHYQLWDAVREER
jgi:hypothetical protein